VDLDELIELKEQRAISDIFAKEGEPYFRALEKKILKLVSKEKKFIVACGGGIVLDKENIKTMKKTGTAICLKADADAVFKRVSGFTHRPLLRTAEPKKQIELLMKMRAPYYAQIDTVIDTSRLPVKAVAEKIIKITF